MVSRVARVRFGLFLRRDSLSERAEVWKIKEAASECKVEENGRMQSLGMQLTGVLKDQFRIRRLSGDLIVESLLGSNGDSTRISSILVPDEDFLVAAVVKGSED